MYQAYLFDFDYTLANSEKGIVTCFELLFQSEGYDGISREAIKHTIGMTMYDAVASLTGETDPARIHELTEIYRVRYANTYMTRYTTLYPETLPLLKTLKSRGAKTCIVSTKTRSRIGETIAKYHLENVIDYVVGAEDVVNAKPAPDGINAACAYLDAAKKDVLYCGDSLYDASAAQNAGVDFAAVTTGTTRKEDFASYPSVGIFPNLSSIATL